MTSALLLNANGEALNTVDILRIMSLIDAGKVDVLENLKDKFIRWQHGSMPFPAVLRLRYFVNVPRRRMVWSRRAVFARDNWRCVYCNEPVDRNTATVDHIVSLDACRRMKINASTFSNTCCACQRCNIKKGSRSLQDTGMKFFDENFIAKTPRANYLILSGDIPQEWKKYIRTG